MHQRYACFRADIYRFEMRRKCTWVSIRPISAQELRILASQNRQEINWRSQIAGIIYGSQRFGASVLPGNLRSQFPAARNFTQEVCLGRWPSLVHGCFWKGFDNFGDPNKDSRNKPPDEYFSNTCGFASEEGGQV